jgi:hypothetical protein
MNTKRIRELCHAVSFDDLDRSSRHDILEILLAEEDRLTAPAAPVAPPTTELPDIELVSDAVHQSWMDGKKAKGITSRKAEDGEELMVPYSELSEAQKDQDRGLVKTVYAAIRSIGVTVLPDAGKGE